MDKDRDSRGDTVTLTYDELAARLGIDVQSARRRALRHRWPKTRGNDGRARVHVPATVLPAAGATDAATNATALPTVAATSDALAVALAELREAHAGRTADRQRAEEAFAKIAGELAGVRQQLGARPGNRISD
jgi:hypothetical protein